MMIGTLAITGVGIPLTHYRFCRLPVEGRDHRKRLWARGNGFAFWALVIAALLHQLLFLAADVHDLLRQAARRPSHA